MPKKNKNNWTHEVKNIPKDTRIIDYCAHHFPILGSKSAAKKAIAGERLLLNGKVAKFSDAVKNGDQLTLRDLGIQQAKKFEVDLEVVFEDDYLIAVNKPGGIAVNGDRKKTVENAVADRTRGNPQPDVLPRPVAVHRIDVPTNGLVLLAKTKSALITMSKAFQDNAVQKEYLAVVHGKTPASGTIDEPLRGKRAVTKFTTLETVPSRVFGHLSLLRLELLTGRTHQLRLHLKSRGHFIVGDKHYADEQQTVLGKGMFLCAANMRFGHPVTGQEICLEMEPPAKFVRLLRRERKRFELK